MNKNPFWPRSSSLFKGPTAPPPPAYVNTTPTAAPAASPPVTERTSEVEAAARQTRQDAAKRKGLSKTLLAGDTGGFKPGANPFVSEQKKTLLG